MYVVSFENERLILRVPVDKAPQVRDAQAQLTREDPVGARRAEDQDRGRSAP